MTNEVTNETENSSPNENPVVEETTMTESTAAPEQQQPEATSSSAIATTAAADDDVAAPTTAQDAADAADLSAVAATSANEQAAMTADDAAASADDTAVSSDDAAASSKEMDFGAILKQFEQEQTIFHAGELVTGKVVGISDRGVLIDFGYKSEGIAPIEDFISPATGESTVKQGDEVEVVIRAIHSGDAPPMLSYTDAVSRKSWTEIEKAYNEETPITGFVVEKTKGGLRVDINGVEAFLPGSQVDSRPNRSLDPFVGHEIEAKIIKFSRKRNNIVLSRKVLTDEVVNKLKDETFGKIAEGYVIEGVIKNLTEYGAFVDIGGIDGLLHVTDMSWNRLQHPGEMFKVNDNVQVKVLKLDRTKDKISLGYKQLIPDPWTTVTEIYPVGAKLKGKVSSVTDYGAFIELEPGVEGLVHVSEMSWSKRSKSPRKLLHAGEEIDVQVLGIDTNDRRISLGMKQLQENPWDTVMNRYHIGQTVKGRVRNLTDFGAFVEIEDGVDGLVHVSDISHSRNIKHPKDVLRRDEEIEAVITSIDPRGRRMSLSIKDLAPSEWETFITNHKPGDVVRGKVSRFVGFGVFVKLGEELEGLCHISELSDERVEKPEDVVSIGQEMDFKILRIEHEDRKIGLSARAVASSGGSREQSGGGGDGKLYSTEAKGGMASLGELMNLKRGGAEEGAAGEQQQPQQPKMNKKERRAQRAMERAAQADEDSVDDDSLETETDALPETPETPTETESPTAETENAAAESDLPIESSEVNAAPEAIKPAAETENPENPDSTADSGETTETPEASDESENAGASAENAQTAETLTADEPAAAETENADSTGDADGQPETPSVENVPTENTEDPTTTAITETDETTATGESAEPAETENAAADTTAETETTVEIEDTGAAKSADDEAEEKSANS